MVTLVVHEPVPGIWGAVQRGKAAQASVHDLRKELSSPSEWKLEIPMRNGSPTGDFIQRDSKGKFVYLLWGASAGQHSCVRRRAKIYFPEPADFPGDHAEWIIEIEGRAKDGLPACATVKTTIRPSSG